MISRRKPTFAAALAGTLLLLAATPDAWTQEMRSSMMPPMPANQRQAYLVKQDQSDCTNTTVPTTDSPNVLGNLWLTRGDDGNTTVKVAMTVTPNTTYHFFLKCVRQLGDIQTGDEGAGFATFTFPTASVGSTYAFDMYPEGAPPGNKFQSVTVNF